MGWRRSMDLVKRDWGASGLNSIDVSIRAIGVLCHTPSLSLASLSRRMSSSLPTCPFRITRSAVARPKGERTQQGTPILSVGKNYLSSIYLFFVYIALRNKVVTRGQVKFLHKEAMRRGCDKSSIQASILHEALRPFHKRVT